ncbi:MAG: hypothetical protein R3B09_07725 [Nannocystaceae bacterium]
MPTWLEVQEYARTRYRLAEDFEAGFKVIWRYDNDRSQQIVVSRARALGREWCRFASPACRSGQLPAEVALRRSAAFPVGSLILDGDIYVVVHSLLLVTMHFEEFDLLLNLVASTADQIEAEFAGVDQF